MYLDKLASFDAHRDERVFSNFARKTPSPGLTSQTQHNITFPSISLLDTTVAIDYLRWLTFTTLVHLSSSQLFIPTAAVFLATTLFHQVSQTGIILHPPSTVDITQVKPQKSLQILLMCSWNVPYKLGPWLTAFLNQQFDLSRLLLLWRVPVNDLDCNTSALRRVSPRYICWLTWW